MLPHSKENAPHFYADGTCGDVVRWLRIAGLNVHCDGDVQALTKTLAKDNQGLLLTRSLSLAESNKDKIVHLPEGLQPAIDKLMQLGLIGELQPLRRCLSCNQILHFIPRHYVSALVPPFVYALHSRFSRCPSCGRIYWSGSHSEKMLGALNEIFNPHKD